MQNLWQSCCIGLQQIAQVFLIKWPVSVSSVVIDVCVCVCVSCSQPEQLQIVDCQQVLQQRLCEFLSVCVC